MSEKVIALGYNPDSIDVPDSLAMPLLTSQRHLFDIPDDIAYFNCASNSPLLNESQRRLHEGVRSKSHPWERTPGAPPPATGPAAPKQALVKRGARARPWRHSSRKRARNDASSR